MYPAPNAPGTNNGLQNNYDVPRFPKAMRDNYDVKVNWNRNVVAPDLGQVLDDGRRRAGPVLPAVRRRRAAATPTVSLWTVGQTWTHHADAHLDANVGSNKMTHQSQGPGLRHQLRARRFGIPGTNSAGVTGPGSADLERYSGMPVSSTPGCRRSATTPAGRRCGATRSATRSRPTSPRCAGTHEIRTGFDFVQLTLDHWQPEVGNPRGTFNVRRRHHRHAGLYRDRSAAGTATRRSCSA